MSIILPNLNHSFISPVPVPVPVPDPDFRVFHTPFCYHSYDYRLNWTPLSPITITNNKSHLCNVSVIFFCLLSTSLLFTYYSSL